MNILLTSRCHTFLLALLPGPVSLVSLQVLTPAGLSSWSLGFGWLPSPAIITMLLQEAVAEGAAGVHDPSSGMCCQQFFVDLRVQTRFAF